MPFRYILFCNGFTSPEYSEMTDAINHFTVRINHFTVRINHFTVRSNHSTVQNVFSGNAGSLEIQRIEGRSKLPDFS